MPRVLRRLRLMTLTLIALMMLAACGGGALPEAPPPAEQGAPDTTGEQEAQLDASTLRTMINNALREHVFLATSTTGFALAGETTLFDAAKATLDGNTDDIAGLVGSIYPDRQAAFRTLWDSHIGMVVDYTTGIATGDQAKAEDAVNRLTDYSQTLADTFEEMTGLPADASQPLILDHVTTLKSVIDKQHGGDLAGAFADLRTAMNHMDMIAKPLAAAIATQQGFIGSAEGDAADLQAGLNGLLQEHVLLAGTATGAALAGNTAGYEAAGTAIGANTDALSAAVGSIYGPDIENTFKELWASHIVMVVDYTTGAATNDQAKIDDAVGRLTEYAGTLADTLEQVTTLPASASRPLILAHITTLKAAIDAQRAGDATAAFANLRAAAGHMHEIANPLAKTIAAQQELT